MTFLTNNQQERINKITEQIVAMIKEEGIEEFEKRIILALRKHSKDYMITCMTEEAMRKCDSTNK